MLEYDASLLQWRQPINNNPYGPSRLIFGSNFSTDSNGAYFTLSNTHDYHRQLPNGTVRTLWSLPKLYVDYMSTLSNTDEGFWLYLVPDAKVRENFLKYKPLKEAMKVYKAEARAARIAKLEKIAWAMAEEGKATYFTVLAKRYGFTDIDTKEPTDKKTDILDSVFAGVELDTLTNNTGSS